MKRLLLALAAAALAFPAGAQGLVRGEGVVRAEPEIARGLDAPRPKVVRASPARVRHVVLSEDFRVDLAKAMPSTDKAGVPLQVGFSRLVPGLGDVAGTQLRLAWEAQAGGRQVAALAVTSPGAVATRLGLKVLSLPAGAVLRFYGASGTDPFEVTAAEVAATPSLPEYWSPVVESPTLVMEVELPPGATPADVRIAAPQVSHLVASPATGFAVAKAASSCNVDASCHQGTWSSESNAVARILYTRDGSTYVCSGTLLADKDTSTSIPYLLTANHCVSSQASASSVQAYWFYRSSACDSGTRGSYRTTTGGGTLLYNSVTTDTALIRLNAAPPAGVTFAGWVVGDVPTLGTALTGIHHPDGDLQKISFGNLRAYYTCVPGSNGNFSCDGDWVGRATFFEVRWRSGVTESGSSGSGLFLDNGRYLVGQLYGGNGSCTEPGSDWYGRFDVAYNAGMSRWLGQAQGTPSAPSTTPAHDYTDLWWNPAESGWGVAITQHDTRLFATWYAYDAAGRPLWVTMSGGTWETATRFAGDLYVTSGPDPMGAFDPARVTRTRVGRATFDFSSSGRGTLTYTVDGVAGTKPIERQPFGPYDSRAVPDYADLWWNAAESGWGLSISQQYRTLFAVWYSYRPDGSPVWYVMSGGTWISGDTYQGTLYRTTAAGTLFGGVFDPASVARIPVGQLTLRFTGSSSAVMTYSVNGVTGSKSITRQPF